MQSLRKTERAGSSLLYLSWFRLSRGWPRTAYQKDSGRVEYVAATAKKLFRLSSFSKTEGIIPAIESSHAIAEAVKRAPNPSKDDIIIINVSGRGDKDVAAIAGLPRS